MDFESRRLLGHHLAPGAASVLTYARDEMVRLQHGVYNILQTISQANFDPDLSRVARLRQIPEHLLPEGADEEYDETDLEESDLDEEEIKQVQECEYIRGFADVQSQKKGFVMHSTSSIVHVLAADGKLLCGRAVGANCQDVPHGVQINSLQFCQQCEHSKLDRLPGYQESQQSVLAAGSSQLQQESGGQSVIGVSDSFRDELFSGMSEFEDQLLYNLAVKNGNVFDSFSPKRPDSSDRRKTNSLFRST